MAGKLISRMGLHSSIHHIFAARNILTAQDALCKTELELMELLDVSLDAVSAAVTQISEIACPPCRTVLSVTKDHIMNEPSHGHFQTHLIGLDNALCGGIPFGAVTEVVAPAGSGKTQFCLMLSVLAALPESHGGLNGNVVYIDTEHKFNSGRMIEIAKSRFPDIFHKEGMLRDLAARVLVLQISSLTELAESLRQLEASVTQHCIKLVIIDSMAALVSSEQGQEQTSSKHDTIGSQASFLKALAEVSRIPVVVTNQVRLQNTQDDKSLTFPFEAKKKSDHIITSKSFEAHLTAALGTNWAHAVNIRLIFESYGGQRFIKIAKSPVSPTLAFPFVITALGIELVGTEFFEIAGQDIAVIHGSGYEDIFRKEE
ncbi:DNA repair protein RAD51 homolog 2 isoform X2 [Cryptomeria japonica]|uniref:DNA repair protein RAD51 homolog 2 isoform X2 n=1 Tax=Cryptomeria japonica TaxID=3369 RepID=UPI0027DA4C9B|nr:DNA repair protein RAD51 homolog 2 isoform X2 [Cryptomeria japonica]